MWPTFFDSQLNLTWDLGFLWESMTYDLGLHLSASSWKLKMLMCGYDCRHWQRCSAASSVWRSWWMPTFVHTVRSCAATLACGGGWQSSAPSVRTAARRFTCTSWSTAAGSRRSHSRLRLCSRATQLPSARTSGIGIWFYCPNGLYYNKDIFK